jgi:HEAT repeat protein
MTERIMRRQVAMHTDPRDRPVEDWAAQLCDAEPARRLEAAAALGRLRRRARTAVPGLASALKDANVHVRKMAALALGDIGADSVIAVPALFEALSDTDRAVRRRVTVALREIATADPEVAPLVHLVLAPLVPPAAA